MIMIMKSEFFSSRVLRHQQISIVSIDDEDWFLLPTNQLSLLGRISIKCSILVAIAFLRQMTTSLSLTVQTGLEKMSLTISAHADGGPRSRVCTPLTLRSAPHRHELGTHAKFYNPTITSYGRIGTGSRRKINTKFR